MIIHTEDFTLNQIKLVLWDIDGTVLNFFESQKNAIHCLFKKYAFGECSEEMLLDYDRINHKYWQALERGELTKQQVLTGRFYEFFKKYNLDTSLVEEFNAEYQLRLGDTICFYNGVMNVILSFQKQGILQFAVTNGTKIAQERKLKKSGLDRIFDAVFISEDVGYEKPDCRFFEPVLAKAKETLSDIALSEIMIIGDSLTSDMKLGKNVGIKTCWFRHPHTEDATLQIDLEISDFTDFSFI